MPNVNGSVGFGFTDSLTYPAVGVFVTSASIQNLAQTAANQDKQLRQGIGVGVVVAYDAWTTGGGSLVGAYGGPIAAGSAALLRPNFPHGGKVRIFRVRLVAQVHVTLPQYKPEIKFLRYSLTGSVTVVGTETDAPANVAAYNAPHDIVLDLGSGTEEVIDRENNYYVLNFTAEDGTNSDTSTVGPARIQVYLG